MAPIKIGFVGLSSTGWASMALMPPLLSPSLFEKFALMAVSTTSSHSASLSAEKYSPLVKRTVKAYHGTTKEIAADPDVDFVVVAVKTPSHRDAVMPAIEAGKAVFVEWPLGNGLQEAEEIAAAARRKGVQTMVGAQSWQNLAVRKVKEWIAAGKIGNVISSTWVGSKPAEIPYWTPVCQKRDAYSVDAANGATALDVAVGHNLSAIIFVLGPLVNVTATTAQFFKNATFIDASGSVKSDGPDQIAFSGVLENSGAILSATWRGGITTTAPTDAQRPSMIWIIDGDKGHIRLESSNPMGSFIQNYLPEKVILNGEQVNVLDGVDEIGSTGRAFEEFAKGPKKGVYPTFDDAVVIQRHVHAISDSAKRGCRVDVKA